MKKENSIRNNGIMTMGSSAKRILIVDDDEQVRNFVSAALRREGYSVVICSNGEEALSKLDQERPQLVLLDILMPGLNGIDVLQHLKHLNKPPSVIMMTAVTDETISSRTMALGAWDYLVKPFSLERLRELVALNLFLTSVD